MFYDKQPSEKREDYKHMLALIGSLSNLFADSDKPMLYYRAHENAFCRYFEAKNHVVKRVPHGMQIYKATFDEIDIDSIKLDENGGNANNTYFTDGRHTYHFSMSKNTLFMIFDDMELLDTFEVNILEDPFEALKKLDEAMHDVQVTAHQEKKPLK